MLIAQLSDLHLVAPGDQLYGHIDTADALARALRRVNGLRPRPARLILSGDLVNGGSAIEYAHLRAHLETLEIPYSLMPGNHDDRAALAAAFPEQGFAGAPLLCQRLDLGDLTLLLLDTVIAGVDGGEAGPAQFAWLAAAWPAERPVFLFLHHPPFATGIAGMDAIGLAGSAALETWLGGRPNLVGIACGHVHRALFTTFAGRPAVIAPAPAHQIALELDAPPEALAYTLEPGGLLLHDWDGSRLRTHVLPVAAAERRRYT